jgi:hypothetical protein
MKKIFCLAMIISSLTLAAQNKPQYVAVKTGLNIREKPDAAAKVLDKIPYGTQISIIQNDEETVSLKTEGLLGYWRKVKYNDKTGYILDSYLFPFPPPKANVKTLGEYLAQLSQPFGNKLVLKSGDEETGWQLDKQLYKNGSEMHELHGYEYGSVTYFLPEFTIQQAFLLTRMLPEFAEAIKEKDEFPRTNKKLKRGDGDYVIKVQTEQYTNEPIVTRVRIEFEQGAIYSFEIYEIDTQVVIYYGSGV